MIGTQTGAIIVVSWSLTTELISPRTRFLARAFANWPTGKFILALICFFSQNWRISLHVCAATTFFGALLYIFFVPESPTYLQCHTIVKQQWEPAPLFIAFGAAIIHFLIAFFFLNESKDANLGEIGFTLRRISHKVSQKINQIRNMTKKDKRPSEVTIPAVVVIERSDPNNPVLTPISPHE
uniref:MFS domain-containing protein n=1 Tax=Caenorhabditis tropicalis TaxID=1561998 RepID=A0A1I7TB97_9PELO